MKKQQSVLCFCFVFFLSTNCFLCIAQGIFLWSFLHCIIMYFSLLSSWCFSLTLFIYFTLMFYQSPSFLYTFSCLYSTTFFHSSFPFSSPNSPKAFPLAFVILNYSSPPPLTSLPHSCILRYVFSHIVGKHVLPIPSHFTTSTLSIGERIRQ